MIWIITGLWILLGCAEAAHLITIITDRSLQTYTLLCSWFSLAGLLMYTGVVCFLFKRQKKQMTVLKTGADSEERYKTLPYTVLLLIMGGVTIWHFCSGYVPEIQDAVYEITLGNVKSGSLMTLHPFLGVETSASMPFRMEILGLSSLYSMLITISQQSAYMIMCKIVPIVLWGFSLLLYWAFAEKFFPKDASKRWLFVGSAAFIYLVTSGSVGMPGYRLFYAGFSGETIRSILLMPYTVYVSWQRKWYLAALAVLAEACLVWTTFGVGYCFLIAVCMFGVHLWADWRAKHADGME